MSKTRNDDVLRRPETPTRNRYYTGKLLDAMHLEMEQAYFNRKRWLLNRLLQGYGVVCGLEVVPVREQPGFAIVMPGVAIDGLGREIIVPEPSEPFDLGHYTDECGRPTDRPVGRRGAVLCLAYYECLTDPAPVTVDECGPKPSCEHGTIQERYCLLVLEDHPLAQPSCPFREMPEPRGDGNRSALVHRLLTRLTAAPCSEGETPPCVPLGRVRMGSRVGMSHRRSFRTLREAIPGGVELPETGRLSFDNTARPIVIGNERLYEMLLCIMDHCCSKTDLTPPVVVGLSKVFEHMIDNQAVLKPYAETVRAVPLDLPALQNWRWRVSFDRLMLAAHIRDGSDWLRIWSLKAEGGDTKLTQYFVKEIKHLEDFTYEILMSGEFEAGTRILLSIRSTTADEDLGSGLGENSIQEKEAPGQALDAEHRPTTLPDDMFRKMWSIPTPNDHSIGSQAEVWDHLAADAGDFDLLPSGDGQPGGWFHSWFEVGAPVQAGPPPTIVNFRKRIEQDGSDAVFLDENERDMVFKQSEDLGAKRLWLNIEFSKAMDEDFLGHYDNWIRVWILWGNARGPLPLTPITWIQILEHELADGNPELVKLKVHMPWDLVEQRLRKLTTATILVSVRGQAEVGGGDSEIVLPAAEAGGEALDGEFSPSRFGAEELQALWDRNFDEPDADGYSNTVIGSNLVQPLTGAPPEGGFPALPSGDGNPGGLFHTWFTLKYSDND